MGDKMMNYEHFNITDFIANIIHSEFGASYHKMANTIGCSDQTFLNWRSGTTEPNQTSIELICRNLPKLITETQYPKLLSSVTTKLNNAGTVVDYSLNRKQNAGELLHYLYYDFIPEHTEDKFYKLLNNSSVNLLLKQLIMEKIKAYTLGTNILQVEDLGNTQKAEMRGNKFLWKLEPEHCFLLNYKEKEQYNYRVLVNFNFNAEQYEQLGKSVDLMNVTGQYGVKMMILFSNVHISEENVSKYLSHNIYIETMERSEIVKREINKNFIRIFSATSDDDAAMDISGEE